jgi:hypothetical protein
VAAIGGTLLAAIGLGASTASVAADAFSLWLVSHRELRTSRPIRVVFEALAQSLMAGSEVTAR